MLNTEPDKLNKRADRRLLLKTEPEAFNKHTDRRLRLRDEDVRQLLRLRDAGLTIRQLAELFGVSRSQAGRIAQGVSRVAPQRITSRVAHRARQAWAEGWTLTRIGMMLGLHRATVRRIIHE